MLGAKLRGEEGNSGTGLGISEDNQLHSDLYTLLLAETNRLEDTIRLPSIDCNLALIEVYDKVETWGLG